MGSWSSSSYQPLRRWRPRWPNRNPGRGRGARTPDPAPAPIADPSLNNDDPIVRVTISGIFPKTAPAEPGTIRTTPAAATALATEATVSPLPHATATILPGDAQDRCQAGAPPAWPEPDLTPTGAEASRAPAAATATGVCPGGGPGRDGDKSALTPSVLSPIFSVSC